MASKNGAKKAAKGKKNPAKLDYSYTMEAKTKMGAAILAARRAYIEAGGKLYTREEILKQVHDFRAGK